VAETEEMRNFAVEPFDVFQGHAIAQRRENRGMAKGGRESAPLHVMLQR